MRLASKLVHLCIYVGVFLHLIRICVYEKPFCTLIHYIEVKL